ncbi:MAG: ATP-binding cassette domain-containing protein [Chthoniobacteraceae bacterium]|nr:ATP-binding cassette domain-containing protein [Chthoniobacteraceae bacterium]
MFELCDVSLLAPAKPQERVVIGDVTATFPPGEVAVVTGPPGSGKSTLLQLLAGVRQPTFGEVSWEKEASARPPVAYLPQGVLLNSPGDRLLTAAEHVKTALRLRVTGQDREERRDEVAALLEKMDLAAEADRRCGELTPGQRRRLAVAVALAGSPGMLLCDETGEAFDPAAESAFAALLRKLAREERMAVVRVTNALDRLEECDTLLVLCGGLLVFHAPPVYLAPYFQLGAAPALFEQLGAQKPEAWRRSWSKHRAAFPSHPAAAALKSVPEAGAGEPGQRPAVPGWFTQSAAVAGRRWRRARRDVPALALQAALLFGAPFAAAFFAAGDLPGLQALSTQFHGDVAELLRESAMFAVEASRGVRLVAGLAIVQPLLLAFVAAATAAREIAGERVGLEIEKHRGLRPSAFVAGEAFSLIPRILAQAAWMGAYVHGVCRLPGSLWMQIGALALAQAAFTAFCLAVSALTRSSTRAAITCFCLAALQLPLSGAALAPPELFLWVVRPLSTLPWGAAAYLQSMEGTRFYEALRIISPLPLFPVGLCALVLAAQTALGLFLAHFGCKIVRLGVAWRRLGT